ncbi:hypothetical protein CSOJ01_00749 [Colletotrichum sojae]|uniref:Uncharacterized protein n=1 Tax=Colletotrichum sojae TaxID=2175907 RepID=A0A8H6JXF5_9PEZI|nr:hypothetical protein CSOJ01_00749 [Colletotrichum sojae]
MGAETWAAVDTGSGEESVQLLDVLSRVSARNTFTSLGGDDGRREPMLWLAASSLGNRRHRSDTHDEDLDYNPFEVWGQGQFIAGEAAGVKWPRERCTVYRSWQRRSTRG